MATRKPRSVQLLQTIETSPDLAHQYASFQRVKRRAGDDHDFRSEVREILTNTRSTPVQRCTNILAFLYRTHHTNLLGAEDCALLNVDMTPEVSETLELALQSVGCHPDGSTVTEAFKEIHDHALDLAMLRIETQSYSLSPLFALFAAAHVVKADNLALKEAEMFTRFTIWIPLLAHVQQCRDEAYLAKSITS